MKSSFKLLALGLLLLVPFAAAHAQAPSLSAIANVSVNAGASVTVPVVAVDASGRLITLTSASLPSFCTLNAPTTGTGVVVTTLTLAPTAANVGTHTASVTATAGGVPTTKTFQITVNAAGSNRAPVVTAPALQNVTAGANLSFSVGAIDADADAITSLSVSGLPSGATFTPNGSYTSGTFSWTPSAAQAGEYDVIFTASNSLSGAAVTHIHVAAAAAVMISPIADVTVAEGATATVNVNVACTAGALVTVTASLPSFATLNSPTTGTGSVSTTITISPPAGAAGTFHASVTATTPGASATETFDIIVTASGGANTAPTLSLPTSRTVNEGAALTFTVTASDVDGDHVTLTASSVPTGATFVDNGINTGTFSWTPGSTQAGVYVVTFVGNDGHGGTVSATTTITVLDVVGGQNHAPTLSAPATRNVNEGATLNFNVTASDVDEDHVTLSVTSALPSGASFSDQGNNRGSFSWTPGSTQAGVYAVTFLGSDGRGGTATATTTITVRDVTDGGGGGLQARAHMRGKFRAGNNTTCFHIRPVHKSFDVRDVSLASIRLRFNGVSIAALEGGATLECRSGGGDDDDECNGDDCDDDDCDSWDGRGGSHDSALGDGHGKGHGDGHDGDDDDDDGDDNDDDGDGGGGGCSHPRLYACFSTQALISLFANAELPRDLAGATLEGSLTGGATFVATFKGSHSADKGKHDDEGRGHRRMNLKAKPNPLNPKTEISFTLSREGRVRVSVYDMQGRLVNKLLDEVRTAGEQKLAWDGSNTRNEKVSSGVYYFRIQAPEGEVVQRVAVVK